MAPPSWYPCWISLENYGLLAPGISALAPDFASLRNTASADAMAALYRLNIGPTGYNDDFQGFDMLMLASGLIGLAGCRKTRT
jgi:hypothetical protein